MADIRTTSNEYEVSRYTLDFRGSGDEYFKIWIVNLFLSIVTIGIYSAWAKVRNKQYFYSNLYLGDDSFRYLASPITILKGRVIAVALSLLYVWASLSAPLIASFIAIGIFLASPWFISRSLIFNHRMTAYRNVKFRFSGAARGAFMAFLIWPILGTLTLGLLYPMAILKANKYVVANSSYGNAKFDFSATFWDYAKVFLIALGVLLTLSVAVFLASAVITALGFNVDEFTPQLMIIMMGLIYLTAFACFTVLVTNLYFESSTLSRHGFEANLKTTDYLQIFLTNILLIVVTLGLYLPWAKVRMARYKSSHLTFIARGSLDNFIADESSDGNAVGDEVGEAFDFDIGAV